MSGREESSDMTQAEVSGVVLLTHEVGLHARPSVKLTKLAKTFRLDDRARPRRRTARGSTPRASSR